VDLLKEANPDVRAAAADALGKLGAAEAVDALRPCSTTRCFPSVLPPPLRLPSGCERELVTGDNMRIGVLESGIPDNHFRLRVVADRDSRRYFSRPASLRRRDSPLVRMRISGLPG
jgi:hypothetical protein